MQKWLIYFSYANKGKWNKYLLKFNNVLLGNERKVFKKNFEKFKTKHFEVPSNLNRKKLHTTILFILVFFLN